jgi:hypothetical protein
MTCRHRKGDPSCSSHPDNVRAHYREEQARAAAALPATPDSEKYSIEDVARFGPHLVLRVRYPNCARCSYEGVKVLVYLNVTEIQVLRWRKIDPHFRDKPVSANEAPGPAARFPASKEGWADACAYARSKAGLAA